MEGKIIVSIPQRIAEQLTEDELLYLYIAHEIWAMSDIWDEAEISDIEDTGGTFDPAKNTLVLDYEDELPFDQDHVDNVIRNWKTYIESGETLPATKLIDKIVYPGATLTDFQNVVVHVTGETGSVEEIWKPRSENNVSVESILEAADIQERLNKQLRRD